MKPKHNELPLSILRLGSPAKMNIGNFNRVAPVNHKRMTCDTETITTNKISCKLFFCSALVMLGLMLFQSGNCVAQKKNIDPSAYPRWETVQNYPSISDDGKFASYEIWDNSGNKKLVLKQISGTKELIFRNFQQPSSFSADSKWFSYISKGDTLVNVELASGKIFRVPNVKKFSQFNRKGESLQARQFRGDSVSIGQINRVPMNTFKEIDDYLIGPRGEKIVLTGKSKEGSNELILYNLETGSQKNIFSGKISNLILNLIFDQTGRRLAFIAQQGGKNELWFCGENSSHAVNMLANYITESKVSGNIVSGRYFGFSQDGSRLYFSLRQSKRNSDTLRFKLDILNSNDRFIDNSYGSTSMPKLSEDFVHVISLRDGKIKQLTNANDQFVNLSKQNDFVEKLTVVKTNLNDYVEEFGSYDKKDVFLLDMLTGKRIKLFTSADKSRPDFISISTNEKFVVFFDTKRKKMVSFELASGRFRDLTIPSDGPIIDFFERTEIFHWGSMDTYFIFGANHNLFLIDPLAGESPVNLTGKKNSGHITFTPVQWNNKVLFLKGKMILSAMDVESKDVSFYTLKLVGSDLKKVYSSAVLINRSSNESNPHSYIDLEPATFQAALSTNAFILSFQRKDVSKNFYFTRDFEHFLPISNVHPETGYNWFQKELLKYKSADGSTFMGLLYKPNNFIADRKYPIIVNIYEGQSNSLNSFNPLQPFVGSLDKPLMLSQGYLIYEPDIIARIPGRPFKDALEAVELAIENLKKLNFIDTSRIALSGASHGGAESRYIIGKSKFKFAAVMSNCGYSNYTTLELLRGNAKSSPQSFRGRQTWAYYPLSKRPDVYLDASSVIFSASNISSPLLMYHNAQDEIPYSQSFLLYCLMREMNKPAWWLNYKDEGHAILNRKANDDFNQRVIDFFDHYLKDKPMPKWMSDYKKF